MRAEAREQIRQGRVSRVDDLAEPVPKLILEADRSLMAGDDDRVLFNGRLHYGKISTDGADGQGGEIEAVIALF